MARKVNEMLINGARLTLMQGDITLQSTDAIVNAANSSLMGGGGVDGAIHQAGGPAILEACKEAINRQGKLPTGQAVITTGGWLTVKYVIHTVGPVWRGGNKGESELLVSAYKESLKLAAETGLASVSFPSISTGVYGYPVDKAAATALGAVKEFLEDNDSSIKEVVFVLFDPRTCAAYEEQLNSPSGYSPDKIDEKPE